MNDMTQTDQAGETPLFDRLGNIVRSLHDALRELGADKVLAEAASEFPSARERLQHIGQLTEKAANTVLNKVEQASPVQERLARTAGELAGRWDAAVAEGPLPAALQALAQDSARFMAEASAGCGSTRAALSDIMMTQDFQDLTGQLIKKVVSMLERTENDLLKLLVDAAPPAMMIQANKEEMMAGPGSPGGIALEQTAVDDLLADLGF